MTNRVVACDIETDGLDPSVIHCIVCKDIKTGEYFTFADKETIDKDFPKFHEQVDKYIGHNFVHYDMFALNKLIPNFSLGVSKVIDTIVLCRLFNYKKYGKFPSLEALGEEVGIKKVEHTDWTTLSDDMIHRCKVDVDITEAAYHWLMKQGSKFSDMSIRLEHNIAYINELQRKRGFKLDIQKVYTLRQTMLNRQAVLEKEVQESFPPMPKAAGVCVPKIKKDNTISTVGLRGIDPTIVCGMFTHVEWETFNMGSTSQVVERMNKLGWKPVDFTPKGTPQVTEANVATLPEDAPPFGKAFSEYLMIKSRLGNNIEPWIQNLEEDGRIHGTIIHVGATTHRQAHIKPNMANIPALGSPYGEECREVFVCENAEDWRLVGTDASGIQLRLLAHYIDDKKFTEVLLSGDIHCYMAAIYVGKTYEEVYKGYQEEEETKKKGYYTKLRKTGKTLTYAICFGAGAKRAASIFDITEAEGQDMIERLFKAIPGLARIKKESYAHAAKGYVIGLDGRLIQVDSSHLVLPALLQGGEAVVMKLAKVLWFNEFKKQNVKGYCVNDVHDEWQTEVIKEQALLAGQIQRDSIVKAGVMLRLNLPLAGESKVGLNWKETH